MFYSLWCYDDQERLHSNPAGQGKGSLGACKRVCCIVEV